MYFNFKIYAILISNIIYKDENELHSLKNKLNIFDTSSEKVFRLLKKGSKMILKRPDLVIWKDRKENYQNLG